MKLIDLVLEVRFSDKAKLLKEDLRIDLLKKVAPSDPVIKQLEQGLSSGIQIPLKEKRIHLTAEETRFGVSVQDKDVSRSIEKIVSYVRLINEAIEYDGLKIARIGIKTSWVHKTTLGFEELKTTYRDSFFKQSSLLETAVDYGVNLTLKDGDFSVNYISGPVTKNEPLPMISFPVNNLNDANIFVSVDYYLMDARSFDHESLGELVQKAVEGGQVTATKTVEDMGV